MGSPLKQIRESTAPRSRQKCAPPSVGDQTHGSGLQNHERIEERDIVTEASESYLAVR